WESPLLTLSTVIGVSDLDGDGSVDIVASSSSNVFVLSSTDGRVLWTNPAGPIGEVGTTHVADLDGDHHPDLYIGECRCCTLRGTSNGVAYSFMGGFATARQLWTLGAVGGCGADADQIADVDGDGQNDLVVSSASSEIQVVSGTTGAITTRIPAPAGGGFYPGTRVYPANLDADPALEMVAVTSGYLTSSDQGARRIAVYDWDGTAFALLWQANAPDRVSDDVSIVDGAIGDLDGDAASEVAFTVVAGGVAHVEIRGGVSGAMRGMIPGARLVGAVDLDNDHLNELLVSEGGMLSAYDVTPTGATRLWSIAGRDVVRQVDHARWVADANASTVLALGLDADPALELIVSGTDATGRSTLWALNADTNPPTEIGHFSAPDGITLLTSAAVQNLTQPYAQVATVTSDGYLIVLDRTMQPTNRITEGEIELPGMRIGGYYSGPYGIGPTPSIARLDTQAVLVRDSRPSLLRLDASSANLTTPPRIVWERRGAAWPVVADVDGDGARDVIVAEGADVVNLDPATATHERWRARGAIGAGGMYGDLLPARRGVGGIDIYLPRALPGAVFQAVAVNGATGDIRWSGFTRALQWGYQSYSVGDLTGDGIDDFVSVTNSTHVLTGADGTLSSDNSTFVAYAMPMQTDANGDGETDVSVHGGYFADRLLTRAMTDVVVRSDRTAPNTGHYGAPVTCAGAAAVVESGYNTGDLWTVRLSDATPLAHRTLASGAVYDVGTVPSDHAIGLVGNVTAVADVGTGHPAVLAGSTVRRRYSLGLTRRGLTATTMLPFVGSNASGAAGAGQPETAAAAADAAAAPPVAAA
ncbi:MAG: VCBS repeat-containing protein, partial [Deltaproteobacteria bacterium]